MPRLHYKATEEADFESLDRMLSSYQEEEDKYEGYGHKKARVRARSLHKKITSGPIPEKEQIHPWQRI